MRVGDKIRFIPELHHGMQQDNKYFTGEVVYINERHHWFAVEYIEGGNRLRESYKFFRNMERDRRYKNGVQSELQTPSQFRDIPGIAIF